MRYCIYFTFALICILCIHMAKSENKKQKVQKYEDEDDDSTKNQKYTKNNQRDIIKNKKKSNKYSGEDVSNEDIIDIPQRNKKCDKKNCGNKYRSEEAFNSKEKYSKNVKKPSKKVLADEDDEEITIPKKNKLGKPKGKKSQDGEENIRYRRNKNNQDSSESIRKPKTKASLKRRHEERDHESDEETEADVNQGDETYCTDANYRIGECNDSGEEDADEEDTEKSRVKYSKKFAHEKNSKNTKNKEAENIMKLHRKAGSNQKAPRKKYSKYTDEDDDSSEEHNLPKRLHYVDEEDEE